MSEGTTAMKEKRERGLCEMYDEDPERADSLLFGRRSDATRRGFLGGAGLAAMSALLGATIPFHRCFPAGLIPAALADETGTFELQGKYGLVPGITGPRNAA